MTQLTILSVIIFIPLVWGKCEFKVYSDDETEKYAGKEVGICIANHRYTNDWILDFIAAEQYRNVSNSRPEKTVHFAHVYLIVHFHDVLKRPHYSPF